MTFDRFNCWLRGWVHTLLDLECLGSFFGGPKITITGHLYDDNDVCTDCGHEFKNIEPTGPGNFYVTGTGQRLLNVHEESPECREHGCIVHCPSEHHMRDFPTHWRSDRRIMERICPHSIGHPDPDAVKWAIRVTGEADTMHGCDGCCHEPRVTDGNSSSKTQ